MPEFKTCGQRQLDVAAQEAVKAQGKQAEIEKGLQSRLAAETAKLQAADAQLGAAKRQLTVPPPVLAVVSSSSGLYYVAIVEKLCKLNLCIF